MLLHCAAKSEVLDLKGKLSYTVVGFKQDGKCRLACQQSCSSIHGDCFAAMHTV